MSKRLPAMWETQVPSLGWEEPLEKEMATRSSILAWRIPWSEEPGGLQSKGLQESGMTQRVSTHEICAFISSCQTQDWGKDVTIKKEKGVPS